MPTKLEQYTMERDKIAAKIAMLEERRRVLDGKIMERVMKPRNHKGLTRSEQHCLTVFSPI